jgi:transcription elongation GreA/GreB family factor
MSKAFTKEDDADGETALPDRFISTYPNLVTAEGLAAITGHIDKHSREHVDALAAGDKEAVARATRELRYWTARRASARIAPAPEDDGTVRFGATVTIERSDGRRQAWRIVGEDEADPAAGTISHASPLATVLLGRSVGDVIEAGASEAEIAGIAV